MPAGYDDTAGPGYDQLLDRCAQSCTEDDVSEIAQLGALGELRVPDSLRSNVPCPRRSRVEPAAPSSSGSAEFRASALDRPRLKRGRSWLDRRRSGSTDGQVVRRRSTKLGLVEREERVVAGLPETGYKVLAQCLHGAALDLASENGPHRRALSDRGLQVCLRATPVAMEEPILANPRDRTSCMSAPIAAARWASVGRVQVVRYCGR